MELFAGLGGMSLGLSAAGFEHRLVVEREAAAVATLRANAETSGWPLHAGDVREVDYEAIPSDVDLLAAGVPCQPFSQGGAHAGPADERNMFPETFAAIRALRPKAVLIENVRGLARPRFQSFVAYLVDHLRAPHMALRPGEAWRDHHRRLRVALDTGGDVEGDRYAVEWRPICAADYGVAQRRVRVIMVAVRVDLAPNWAWPEPTHCADALLRDKLDRYYWTEHGLEAPELDLAASTIRRAQRLPRPLQRQRWRTLRDVIGDLPEPASSDEDAQLAGHVSWPGARLYRGHSGSLLDEVSKTIKAGVHGVAGGEHIVHLDDGSYRYLTVRECMRIQDLPDTLKIDDTRTAAMRQIGNAVPPRVAEVFGLAIVQAVCQPRVVPRAQYVQRQDAAAGGFLRRQVSIGGRRLTASVRIQREYAYLYFVRSAGNPIYLGSVGPGTREDQLRRGWERAHNGWPQLFIALEEAEPVHAQAG